MTIVFLCGSLEPAKDGVGDYTRRLAAELYKNGNKVAAIALNDKFINDVLVEKQSSDGVEIPMYRLPNSLTGNSVYRSILHYWVSTIDPDWLSLQYVPFSFHKYGVPFNLGNLLRSLGEGRKYHIMFHELWVGMEKVGSLKHLIWGETQRYIAKRLIAQLAPQRVHTQASLYQVQLAGIGCKARILPLFGNIPVCNSAKVKTNHSVLKFLIFGEIQPKAPFAEFLKDIYTASQLYNKMVEFNFVGRNGNELDAWLKLCRSFGFECKVFGEQDPEKISAIIKECDWGISSTPFYQIEKSGTVAAMKEHQLPVYCVAREWTPRRGALPIIPDFVRKYKIQKINLDYPVFQSKHSCNVKEVAENFEKSLS